MCPAKKLILRRTFGSAIQTESKLECEKAVLAWRSLWSAAIHRRFWFAAEPVAGTPRAPRSIQKRR